MNPSEQKHELPVPLKNCSGPCMLDLPLTEEHWDRDSSRADGFRHVCKKCRALARQLKKGRSIEDAIKRLDRTAKRALQMAENGGNDVPHMAETLEHIVRLLGGVQGLARHYVANMLASAPGSQTRERMLSQILKLNVMVTQEGATTLPSEMTNEDLERELERREIKLRVINAKVTDVTIPEAG